LRELNLPLKYCKLLKKLISFEEGFRSFHKFDIRLVGERAAKLLPVSKGLLPKSNYRHAALVRLCPSLNHSQSLTDSNFAALWPTDPILTLWKDVNDLSIKWKWKLAVQVAGRVLCYDCNLRAILMFFLPALLNYIIGNSKYESKQWYFSCYNAKLCYRAAKKS